MTKNTQRIGKASACLYTVLTYVPGLSTRQVLRYMRVRGYSEEETLRAAADIGMPVRWHLADTACIPPPGGESKSERLRTAPTDLFHLCAFFPKSI
ncbi:hypothetical protein [Hydrogenophaga sp. 5NK40-0174]|uniref:hypothetical protein n=1 Tax=Hydrogenophaga sp. 5NK40-0174 TaxID=3127649 RepID=UPI0031050B97